MWNGCRRFVNILNDGDYMKVYIVYEKGVGFTVCRDRTDAAAACGVHPITIKRWLPFHEDARFIVGICEYRKSNKGTNNFKK